MNDETLCKQADDCAEVMTRVAVALRAVDHRRTTLDGRHEGDDMTPLGRMRFASNAQPKAARYDAGEPGRPIVERCTCGHGRSSHNVLGSCMAIGNAFPVCVCVHYEPDTATANHSDPTGNAAIRPDRANAQRRRVEAIVRSMTNLADELAGIVAEHGPARPASDADRARLAKANTTAPKVCDSCGDLPLKVENSDVKGNLPKPMALCAWCYEGVVRQGTVPTEAQKNIKASGGKVRWPDANHVGRKVSA